MQTDLNQLLDGLKQEFSVAGILVNRVIYESDQTIVVAARQTMLQREVAVKIHRTLASDDVNSSRFRNEAKLLSTFSHPNIVAFYGSGSLADGSTYFLMELLSGTSLKELLAEQGRLQEEFVVRCAISICSALSYAHKQGIIHRDLKPGNIMVVQENTERVFKLIDFGIHKSAEKVDGALTRTGVPTGTANYMSPEQCRADVLDVRSDIYSLGCVLFELLTGEAPMAAQNQWMIMDNHLNKRIKQFPADVKISGALQAIILKALEKNPADRWQTADSLQSVLAECALSPGKSDASRVVAVMSYVLLAVIIAACYCARGVVSSSNDNSYLRTTRSFAAFEHENADKTNWTQLCRNWLAENGQSATWSDINMALRTCISETPWTNGREVVNSILNRTDTEKERAQNTNELRKMVCKLYCQVYLKSPSAIDTWRQIAGFIRSTDGRLGVNNEVSCDLEGCLGRILTPSTISSDVAESVDILIEQANKVPEIEVNRAVLQSKLFQQLHSPEKAKQCLVKEVQRLQEHAGRQEFHLHASTMHALLLEAEEHSLWTEIVKLAALPVDVDNDQDRLTSLDNHCLFAMAYTQLHDLTNARKQLTDLQEKQAPAIYRTFVKTIIACEENNQSQSTKLIHQLLIEGNSAKEPHSGRAHLYMAVALDRFRGRFPDWLEKKLLPELEKAGLSSVDLMCQYAALAHAWRHAHIPERAIVDYAKAASYCPQDRPICGYLTVCTGHTLALLAAHRFIEAEQPIARAFAYVQRFPELKNSPEFRLVQTTQISTMRAIQKPAEAIPRCLGLLNTLPTSDAEFPNLTLELAYLYLSTGQIEKQKEQLRHYFSQFDYNQLQCRNVRKQVIEDPQLASIKDLFPAVQQ